MIFNKILIFIISFNINILISSSKCIKLNFTNKEFYQLKKYQRSNKSIVGLRNFEHIEDCANMTRKLRGLAFNFSKNWKMTPVNTSDISQWKMMKLPIMDQPEEFFNCIALKCPEFSNFSTMVDDNRYDYYSLYANPAPPSNATCIPGIGMFHFYTTPSNYMTAFEICRTQSRGALAHVASEARTTAISRYLETFQKSQRGHLKLAYVGLNFSLGVGGGNILTPEGESLDCFLYRAWAPGYPRGNRNSSCVAITTEASWIDVDCRQKRPFLCEIYLSSSGPSKQNRNYKI